MIEQEYEKLHQQLPKVRAEKAFDDSVNRLINSLNDYQINEEEKFLSGEFFWPKRFERDIDAIKERMLESNKKSPGRRINYPVSFQNECIKNFPRETREEIKQLFKDEKNITNSLNKQIVTLETMFKKWFPHIDHKRRHTILVRLIKEAQEYYVEDSFRDVSEPLTTSELVVESPSEIYELQREPKGYLEHVREYAKGSLSYVLRYVWKQPPQDK